jgi:hypothetical protein
MSYKINSNPMSALIKYSDMIPVACKGCGMFFDDCSDSAIRHLESCGAGKNKDLLSEVKKHNKGESE